MTAYAIDDLKKILALHAKYLAGDSDGVRANLQYADLRSADLRSADLQSANLQSANLQSANLQYANLQSANLQYANLQYANLQSANLQYANLQYANLRSANLQSADLRSAVLSDGVRWEEYLSELVPALLVAGGKQLAEVATVEHWACHSWNGDSVGCPMAVAFNARTLMDIPALYRGQAERFIQLFDAEMIPLPTIKNV